MASSADKARALREAALVAIAVAGALTVFQAVVGLKLLSGGAGAWIRAGGARALANAAAQAVASAQLTFPLGMTHALSAPIAASAASLHAPLWPTLLAKGVTDLGGPVLSPLGLTLLLASAAQPWGAIALLRSCGVRGRLWLGAGAILALLTPVWLGAFAEPWRAAQALVLVALALGIGAARQGLTPRRSLAFAVLGLLAPGFDVAFLIPIATALAAACATEVLQRPTRWPLVASAVARFALAAGVSLFALGYGLHVPPDLAALTPGPAHAAWTALLFGAGAGVLALTPVAAWLWREQVAGPGIPDAARRYGPLVLVFAGLALFGLAAGQGLFVCGAAYLLLAAAVASVSRLDAPRRAALLIAAAILLQIPQAVLAAGASRRALRAEPQALYPPSLDTGVADGRGFFYVAGCDPATIDRARFTNLALLAVRHGGNIGQSGACRVPASLQVPAGAGDPRLLYLPPAAQKPTGRSDCAPLSSGWICGRGMDLFAGGRTAQAAAALEPAEQIAIGANDPRLVLGEGWSAIETDHVWSDARHSYFTVIAPRVTSAGLTLSVELQGFQPPGQGPQVVEVRSNFTWLTTWRADGGVRTYSAHMPASLAQTGQPLAIRFMLPKVYPGNAITVGDTRALGVALRSVSVRSDP